MTTNDLKDFFKSHLVPSKYYSLHGNHKNRICLEQNTDGWDVYFSDKKTKVGVLHYKTENEACQSMLCEIKKMMEQIYGLTWNNQYLCR